MKYAVNESVLACTPFGLRNATVLSARAEKQPAGNVAHVYELSVLNSDGSEMMQGDFDECEICPSCKKVDANLTHRKVKPILSNLATATEDIVYESARKADIEVWKEEIGWDETLTDEEKAEELESLDLEVKHNEEKAAAAKKVLPQLRATAWALLGRLLEAHIRIGQELTGEIIADLARFKTLGELLTAGGHEAAAETPAPNVYALGVPVRLSA